MMCHCYWNGNNFFEFKMTIEKGFINSLGILIGVPEDALRLLIGMLLAYPVSIFYIKSPIKYFWCKLPTSLLQFDGNIGSLVDIWLELHHTSFCMHPSDIYKPTHVQKLKDFRAIKFYFSPYIPQRRIFFKQFIWPSNFLDNPALCFVFTLNRHLLWCVRRYKWMWWSSWR